MYAIYAYIGVVWGVNVGIYSIHGVYGIFSWGGVEKRHLGDSFPLAHENQQIART